MRNRWACPFQQVVAVVVAVRREAQGRVEVEGVAQQGLAGAQRQAGGVPAVQAQQVEEVVRDGDRAGSRGARVGFVFTAGGAGDRGRWYRW
ncbi:hypothetical protein [Kitasatospora aureofaciens]|uniref:hypothetical protein n=1 Tax=Kitasatospora aureofaciens TaxID=1894 RepID=UPI001C445B1A|nr:hypothetical protein [Kitasatospora aureofaciens]